MIDALLLRFDAPLMSFGGPKVDAKGGTRRAPGQSMITGLLANALGYDRHEAPAHQRLQDRLRFATRCDRAGEALLDFQTVDLGRPHMRAAEVGWTTRGRVEPRAGASKEDTHIRERAYWADAVYTVALTLDPADEPPTLAALAAALRRPARPLFIGRKPCLPARPILEGLTTGDDLVSVLAAAPRIGPSGDPGPLTVWFDAPPGAGAADPQRPIIEVIDARDWANATHGGRRFIERGVIDPPERRTRRARNVR